MKGTSLTANNADVRLNEADCDPYTSSTSFYPTEPCTLIAQIQILIICIMIIIYFRIKYFIQY